MSDHKCIGCGAWLASDRPYCDSCEEAEANARLIAAAPELLAALQEVEAWARLANPAGYGGLPLALQRIVDAALSKATSPASTTDGRE